MTFVGKILVVLHLVLAVVFMGFAGAIYTAQVNWRTAKENTQKQLDVAKKELVEKSTALTQAADAAAKKEADLQQQVTQLTGEKKCTDIAEHFSGSRNGTTESVCQFGAEDCRSQHFGS